MACYRQKPGADSPFPAAGTSAWRGRDRLPAIASL